MPETNDKFQKYLYNQVTFFIAVIGFVTAGVLAVTGPDAQLQQDVALIRQEISIIKTNHLVHIQAAIDDNKVKSTFNAEQIIDIKLGQVDMNNKLDNILYLLEKHLGQ